MAQIISFRKRTILPFPETRLRAFQTVTISSMPARGRIYVGGLIVGAEAIKSGVRIRAHDLEKHELTNGELVSAELLERLPLQEMLGEGQEFQIEVCSPVDCLFVGALRCTRLWDK